jgi:hypothetical protein
LRGPETGAVDAIYLLIGVIFFFLSIVLVERAFTRATS